MKDTDVFLVPWFETKGKECVPVHVCACMCEHTREGFHENEPQGCRVCTGSNWCSPIWSLVNLMDSHLSLFSCLLGWSHLAESMEKATEREQLVFAKPCLALQIRLAFCRCWLSKSIIPSCRHLPAVLLDDVIQNLILLL